MDALSTLLANAIRSFVQLSKRFLKTLGSFLQLLQQSAVEFPACDCWIALAKAIVWFFLKRPFQLGNLSSQLFQLVP
jgi:hypothetical protein